MSRLNLVLSVLISSVVGVVAAVVTAGIMSSSTNETPAEPMSTIDSTQQTISHEQFRTVFSKLDSEKLRSLEKRIDELSDNVSDEPNDNGSDENKNSEPPLSREEGFSQYKKDVAELEKRHQEDPLDPTWSPEAQRYLTTGLETFGDEVGFSLQNAECRTNSCKAVVRWNDLDTAERYGTLLAGRTFPGLNCSQTVLLKDPTETLDTNISETATLYFDCSEQRAGAAEVLMN